MTQVIALMNFQRLGNGDIRRRRLLHERERMKLVVDKFAYEAAVLSRYWETAKLSKGCSDSSARAPGGFCYSIKFVEPGCLEKGRE